MRIMRWIWMALAVAPSLLLIVVNLRLYALPAASYAPDRRGPDVLDQLRFLRAALDDGAGERMQRLFPEGFFFSHVLYGLAWVEVGLREPAEAPLRAEALREARWALDRLDLPAGRAPFSPDLNPPFGVFYVGWASWLRGGTLLLEAPEARDPAVLARFERDCAALASAFDQSPTPFLSAYPGQSWPVDSVVAIAALRLHDRLVAPRHQATIERWLAAAQQRLDPQTGLLPHQAHPQSGVPLDGARGSSQSIIARFLPEIDPGWAAEQYAAFRRQFVATPLGVPGVREYPRGADGRGDVDSGPLIVGVSASATVVTLGAALANGDRPLAEAILHTTEAFGLPWSADDTKRYAFGMLPVGDAFLAWAKTGRHWTVTAAPAEWPPLVAWWWRLPLHLVSLILLGLLWLPPWLMRRHERRKRAATTPDPISPDA